MDEIKRCIDKIRSEPIEYPDYYIYLTYGALRDLIFDYYNYRCVRCGANKKLELHHVVPLSFDDRIIGDKITNLYVPLCAKCHPRGAQ